MGRQSLGMMSIIPELIAQHFGFAMYTIFRSQFLIKFLVNFSINFGRHRWSLIIRDFSQGIFAHKSQKGQPAGGSHFVKCSCFYSKIVPFEMKMRTNIYIHTTIIFSIVFLTGPKSTSDAFLWQLFLSLLLKDT